jgi:hypothetical protein
MMRLHLCAAFLALLGLAGSASADQIVNNFDSGLQTWRFDFGGPGSTLSNDPTQDSTGNPASGALKMVMPFDVALGGNNKFAFTGDLFFPGQNFAGSFTELKFDLKIDPSSALDAFGNHGFFAFVSRETDGYNYNQVLGLNLPQGVGAWTTYTVPTTSMLATRAFTIQNYGGPSQNIQGNITMWMDNIRLVPEPGAWALMLTGLLGIRALRTKQ